jgi:hypothetical protein
MLRGDVWAFVIETDGSNNVRLANRWIKPRGRRDWIRREKLLVDVMVDSSITRVRPKLDERMPVGGFGSSSVISGKEQEAQQRHAPEET